MLQLPPLPARPPESLLWLADAEYEDFLEQADTPAAAAEPVAAAAPKPKVAAAPKPMVPPPIRRRCSSREKLPSQSQEEEEEEEQADSSSEDEDAGMPSSVAGCNTVTSELLKQIGANEAEKELRCPKKLMRNLQKTYKEMPYTSAEEKRLSKECLEDIKSLQEVQSYATFATPSYRNRLAEFAADLNFALDIAPTKQKQLEQQLEDIKEHKKGLRQSAEEAKFAKQQEKERKQMEEAKRQYKTNAAARTGIA